MKTKHDLELARAFKWARHYLSPTRFDSCTDPRKHEYICHCLECASYLGKISAVVTIRAKDVILDRLGSETMYSWLSNRSPEFSRAVGDDRFGSANGAKLQRTRRAWLNSLIKEFGGRP